MEAYTTTSLLDGDVVAKSVDMMCPCQNTTTEEDFFVGSIGNSLIVRRLVEEDDKADPETWETVYTIIVLVLMFVVLAFDKFGADSIMMATLAAFLVVSFFV
jgi:hypothetical protein